mmetsp:Transcript_20582/g.37186  ORF Transcript_20582/g.37186 Transcript_20582/m.37186 type:complete len:125 (-) Transcript_20582:15-389(-)
MEKLLISRKQALIGMRSFRGQCGKSASIISSHERACLDLICKAHSWLGLCFKMFGSIPAVCAVDEPFTEAECCYSQKISCTVQETGISRLLFKRSPAVHLGSTWHIFQSGQWLALSSDCYKKTT